MAGKKGYGAYRENCLLAFEIYVLDFRLIRIIYEDAIKKCIRIEIN